MRGKYNAKKTSVDGLVFDSRREANRYVELREMESSGEISDLQRQVRVELVPPFDRNGQHFRGIYYVVDFTYTNADGSIVWEDVKGVKTSVYCIKRKLVAYRYGVSIKET